VDVNLADEEPWSERTRAAGQAGLRSGFSFPDIGGREDHRRFGVLFPSDRTADEEFLTIMGHIGSQLGQVIIRQRAEADLQGAKGLRNPQIEQRANSLTTP